MKTISNKQAVTDSLSPQTTAAWNACYLIQLPEVFEGRTLWSAYAGCVAQTKQEVEKASHRFIGQPHRIVRPD